MKAASGKANIVIALNDCGAIPFYSGFLTVDLAGLNNRAIALGGTAEVAIQEIKEKNPNLVVLVSNKKHGLTSLKGWERLTSEDAIQCGYRYAGTMTVDADYHLLLFGHMGQDTSAFLGRLELTGVLEVLSTTTNPKHQGQFPFLTGGEKLAGQFSGNSLRGSLMWEPISGLSNI